MRGGVNWVRYRNGTWEAAFLRKASPFGPRLLPRHPKSGCQAGYALFRLPVIRRRRPLRNFGALTQTMRTFISLSPPAHTNQQKPGGHQQAARQRRPCPARNTQKQKQQTQPDQRDADQLRGTHALPVGSLRRTTASSLMHCSSPVSLPAYAPPRPRMTASRLFSVLRLCLHPVYLLSGPNRVQ